MKARSTAIMTLSLLFIGSSSVASRRAVPKPVAKAALERQLGLQVKALWDTRVEPAIKDVIDQNPDITQRPVRALLVFIPDAEVWPWVVELVKPEPLTPSDDEVYFIRRKPNECAGNPVCTWAVIRDLNGDWTTLRAKISIKNGKGWFEVYPQSPTRKELLGLIGKLPTPVPYRLQVMAHPYLQPDEAEKESN